MYYFRNSLAARLALSAPDPEPEPLPLPLLLLLLPPELLLLAAFFAVSVTFLPIPAIVLSLSRHVLCDSYIYPARPEPKPQAGESRSLRQPPILRRIASVYAHHLLLEAL